MIDLSKDTQAFLLILSSLLIIILIVNMIVYPIAQQGEILFEVEVEEEDAKDKTLENIYRSLINKSRFDKEQIKWINESDSRNKLMIKQPWEKISEISIQKQKEGSILISGECEVTRRHIYDMGYLDRSERYVEDKLDYLEDSIELEIDKNELETTRNDIIYRKIEYAGFLWTLLHITLFTLVGVYVFKKYSEGGV